MWGKSNVLVCTEGHTKMLEGIFLKCPFLEDFSELLGMFGALSLWHKQEYFEGMVMEAFQSSCWHTHLQASPPTSRDFEHCETATYSRSLEPCEHNTLVGCTKHCIYSLLTIPPALFPSTSSLSCSAKSLGDFLGGRSLDFSPFPSTHTSQAPFPHSF